jgi:hypothetical protein
VVLLDGALRLLQEPFQEMLFTEGEFVLSHVDDGDAATLVTLHTGTPFGIWSLDIGH